MKNLFIILSYITLFICGNASALTRMEEQSNLHFKTGYLKLLKTENISTSAHSLLGYSVSVNGEFAAVSAPMEPIDSVEVGVVYIYKKENDSWNFFQRIEPSEPEHLQMFGAKVVLKGNTLFVASPRDREKYGTVSVFEFNSVKWDFKQTLVPQNPILFQKFGTKIDFNESVAVISSVSSNEDFLASGIVYVFQKENDSWIEKEMIYSPQTFADDLFGTDLKIVDNNHILVSAPKGLGSAEQSGVVYSFIKSETAWDLNQKITHEFEMDDILFGNSMDYDEGNLIIGCIEAPVDSIHCGDATLFTLQENNKWTYTQRFVPEEINTQDHFGAFVNIDQTNIIIGSPKWDNSERDLDHGTVYCYSGNGQSWQLTTQIFPEEDAAYDHLGLSFVLNGNDLIIGNCMDDNQTFNDGSVNFYSLEEMVSGTSDEIVSNGRFLRNTPNPFKNTTTIEYYLPHDSEVNLSIFDLSGKKIAELTNKFEIAGLKAIVWNGKDNSGSSVSPGTYIYKIQTPDYMDAKALIILKK